MADSARNEHGNGRPHEQQPQPAPPVPRTPEEIAKMSPAERLDCVANGTSGLGSSPNGAIHG